MKPTTILIAALVTAAAAQTPSDMRAGFGTTMKQNTEALRQYSYKRRTSITMKGQTRAGRVELVRYVDGRMETVPLEAPERPAAPQPTGPLRERMIQKKREEMKEEVESISGLLRRYNSFDSDGMRAALARATVSRTGPEPDAGLKVVATGIVEPSDSVTFTWSITHHRPERIEIRTELNGKPVNATVDIASLPDGPFYAARTVIAQPKKDISISIVTFDYIRDGGGR